MVQKSPHLWPLVLGPRATQAFKLAPAEHITSHGGFVGDDDFFAWQILVANEEQLVDHPTAIYMLLLHGREAFIEILLNRRNTDDA